MRPKVTDTPLARVGSVDVSKFETATGARLHLKLSSGGGFETYLDPLELEGLTRLRYKPLAVLKSGRMGREGAGRAPEGEATERLQNEFAMVSVGVNRSNPDAGLLIKDMNAGQTVLLSAQELEALLAARHMDLAPLIDTSDLVAIPEPDIDQA